MPTMSILQVICLVHEIAKIILMAENRVGLSMNMTFLFLLFFLNFHTNAWLSQKKKKNPYNNSDDLKKII